MPKKLLFNFNREVIQNYTYVKYVGTIITATNTLEKPIKSAILKGSTKYRDIDTGEILETFEDGRNLELVSVRMPVLTTTGKNLFNEDMLTSNFIKNEEGRYIVNGISAVSGASFAIVNIDATKIYTITVSCTTDSWCNLLIKYKNGETTTKAIGNKTASVTTMYSDKYEVDYIVAYGSSDTYVYDIQIEKGTTATPYEPYKSNILTVNEDVTLRGVSGVKDELDCLTGEITQRIVEIVLDGSEDWFAEDHRFTLEGVENLLPGRWSLLLSDKYPSYSSLNSITQYASYIVGNGWAQGFHIRDVALFPNPKNQLSEFKEYLSQNPVTVQYQSATESVKTVDLSILDQNGNKVSSISSFNDTTHITASSETIPPIFEGYLATKEVE